MNFYDEINKAVIEGETGKVVQLIKAACGQLYPAERILNDGLIKGIEMVAEKFRDDELMVPEVIMSTRALQVGLKVIQPYLKKTNPRKKMKIAIGTVAGDLHDIGKNIIKVVISTLDIEIIDLGIDVSVDEFVKSIKNDKPEILMISALLTTTLNQMKTIIKALEDACLRKKVLIFVGGAPVTAEYAKEIGADYYFSDSIELRDFLKKMLK